MRIALFNPGCSWRDDAHSRVEQVRQKTNYWSMVVELVSLAGVGSGIEGRIPGRCKQVMRDSLPGENATRANVNISAAAIPSDAMLVWLLREKPQPEWSVLFWPKLRAGLQVSHIRIVANQTCPCLLFCAWVLFIARRLRLKAYTPTLTLRLNPEPQPCN